MKSNYWKDAPNWVRYIYWDQDGVACWYKSPYRFLKCPQHDDINKAGQMEKRPAGIMSTHTPGTWAVDLGEPLNLRTVCKLTDRCSVISNCYVSTDGIEANAVLIAAAPDLLEALKELRSCIDETRGSDAHKALIKAVDAIKKAEGGE